LNDKIKIKRGRHPKKASRGGGGCSSSSFSSLGGFTHQVISLMDVKEERPPIHTPSVLCSQGFDSIVPNPVREEKADGTWR